MKKGDRKTRIEETLKAALDLRDDEAAYAWGRLAVQLDFMCSVEARPPRFNGLLRAIWIAATNESS